MKMSERLIKTIESKKYETITDSTRTPVRANFVEPPEASCYSGTRLATQQRSGDINATLPAATTTADELAFPPPTRERKVRHKGSVSPNFRTKWCRRYRSWSQRWQRVVGVLTVFLWVGHCHAHGAHSTNICQERYNGTADRICRSMDLRNNISALDKLCRCRIIDGHLHFVLQEQHDNSSLERLSRYSFPGLREITHHLLIYRVFNLTTLRRLFPNLAVIRGNVLFHNYALVIYDVPSLQEVGLVSLSVILRGSVRIERNPKLCYVHTVDWNHITGNRLAENYINRNRRVSECPACPEELGCLRYQRCGAPRCWGPTHCQTLCGSECPGGCVGDQCCHEECIGGCRTPDDTTTCHACRNLLDQGRCTQSCSSPMFKVSQHRCEPRDVCSASHAIKWDTRECVDRCPTGYNETILLLGSRAVAQCLPCRGFVCPKHCPATTVGSISHAQMLRGCTIINGYLTIDINGGENIEGELEENLSSIQEVTGFLKIFRSNLTSLSFLNNLTRIGGEVLLHRKWSTMEMGAGNATIVNLEPYTRYAVYVKTYSLASSAKRAQSDVLYAITSPYNPTEPVRLGWTSPNSSSLEVWWEPPRRPNGVIDHYLVTLTLLPDTPRIPPHLDFCSHETRAYVDKNIVTIGEDDVTAMSARRTPKAQEEAAQEETAGVEGDDSCRVKLSPSCCVCQNVGPGGDQEVIGQIGFEDFIMDNVYVKKINRYHRATHWNLFTSDEKLEAKLRMARQTQENNTLVKNMTIRVLQEDSAIHHPAGNDGLSRLLSGQQEEELIYHQSKVEEFPFYQGQMVHEFPIHAGIQADYQAHEENLTQYDRTLNTHSSMLRYQVRMTREPQVSLHNLQHFSLYLVEVIACQAPNRVPIVDQHGRLSFISKLCSSIPARVAAFTRASRMVDDIPEGSVRPVVQNSSSRGSVVITWAPPKNPNGGVVAYIFKIQGRVNIERCVSSRSFQNQGRKVELHDLSPGNYSISVKIRSKAMYGNFSTPAFFVIPDDTSSKQFSLVVISMVVAWVIVAAIVCWCWRRYKARYTIPDTIDKVDINPYYCEGFAPAEMFRQDLILWRGDLKVLNDRPLGHGVFGMVFEGELSLGGHHTRVAVKTHNERATHEEICQFLKEAALMQNISCHHVVQLLGVVGDYSPVYVVMELMQLGDLKSFLKKRPPNFLTGQKMLEMAVEAADGMAYLAASKLVHRDLAARNCMLDLNLTLKIGDFGLSRNLKSHYYRKEGQGVLPVKWMAPESLQFSVYSSQSDVWSYGVLLWEMATRGVTPYKNRTNDEVIRLVVERYATLGRPRNCPQPLQRVMRRCWRYEARERPSFLSITKFLLKHTSAEYQHRFEGLSFYHSRYSDYSRYQQKERSGFMAETARESNDENHSDDLALATSSDLSDEDTPEKEFVRYRRTPHRNPKSGRTSPRPSELISWSGRASFGRTADEVGVRSDLTVRGRCSGLSQDSMNKQLFTNFSDDSGFNQSVNVGGVCRGLAAQKGAGLPILLTPQDKRELHQGTSSTVRSGNSTLSSFLLAPHSSLGKPFFNSAVSPGLARSLSSLTQTALESSQMLTNTSQSSTKFGSPSPNLINPVYSNLQTDFSSLEIRRSQTFSVTPPDECSRLDIPSFFSEDTNRSPPSKTISAPSTPYNSQQQNKGIPESSVTSATSHTSSRHTPPKPESLYVDSNTST